MGFPFRRVFTCVIKVKHKLRSCFSQLRQAVKSLNVSLIEPVEDLDSEETWAETLGLSSPHTYTGSPSLNSSRCSLPELGLKAFASF